MLQIFFHSTRRARNFFGPPNSAGSGGAGVSPWFEAQMTTLAPNWSSAKSRNTKFSTERGKAVQMPKGLKNENKSVMEKFRAKCAEPTFALWHGLVFWCRGWGYSGGGSLRSAKANFRQGVEISRGDGSQLSRGGFVFFSLFHIFPSHFFSR